MTEDGVLLYAYRGCVFRVPDDVQPPKAGSRFFCQHVEARPGERVLEIGAGLGMAAVLAARAGASVVATGSVLASAGSRRVAERRINPSRTTTTPARRRWVMPTISARDPPGCEYPLA